MVSLCLGIMVMDTAHAQSVNDSASTKPKNPALARYTRDLTKLARQGKLEPGNGQEAAVRSVIQIFSRTKQNNPVLIGEEGLNSTTVVAGLAQRIASGRVPENLRQTRLYSLNLDVLLAGVKTTAELQGRLETVLSEASEQGNSILFIDPLYQFVGKHAEQTVSETLTEATAGGKVRLIGATSRGAYDEYIAGDAMLDSLFQQVNLDDFKASETSDNQDASEDANKRSDDFKGEKISDDLRQLMNSANRATDRVNVILQVDDVKSGRLNDLFKRYGVEVNAQMPRLGALVVEVPVKALEELAARSEIHHLSADREVRSFGHVSATTGADLVRQQTTTSLLGGTTNYTLDGSGVGIAVLDSGIDTGHKSFLATNSSLRVVFSKDFTGENRIDDPYGHGTHVAATAAGNGRVANGKYIGIAPNANIINLRVLNSVGAGSVSALLSALDWVMNNRATYNIRVVNMSLGMPAVDSYKNDPVCRAVRRLVDAGVVGVST
jgi:subtilisin family serine protease